MAEVFRILIRYPCCRPYLTLCVLSQAWLTLVNHVKFTLLCSENFKSQWGKEGEILLCLRHDVHENYGCHTLRGANSWHDDSTRNNTKVDRLQLGHAALSIFGTEYKIIRLSDSVRYWSFAET